MAQSKPIYVNKDWQGIWEKGAKVASCDQLTQPLWAKCHADTTPFLNWYRQDSLPTLLDQLITVTSILRMTALYGPGTLGPSTQGPRSLCLQRKVPDHKVPDDTRSLVTKGPRSQGP